MSNVFKGLKFHFEKNEEEGFCSFFYASVKKGKESICGVALTYDDKFMTLRNFVYHTPNLQEKYEKKGLVTALFLACCVFYFYKGYSKIATEGVTGFDTGEIFKSFGLERSNGGFANEYPKTIVKSVRQMPDVVAFCKKMETNGVTLSALLALYDNVGKKLVAIPDNDALVVGSNFLSASKLFKEKFL